jgi:hypothetical protein
MGREIVKIQAWNAIFVLFDNFNIGHVLAVIQVKQRLSIT